MVMQEQARRLSEPLRWGRRERTAIAGFLLVCVVALGALGIYALTSGSPARADCIRVNFASTLGGGEIHGCGAKARGICTSGSFRGIDRELHQACTRAGFAYKSPS
jgi:hypothetical protein